MGLRRRPNAAGDHAPVHHASTTAERPDVRHATQVPLPARGPAAERGARVLIIDKAPQLGGTLHISTGQIAGAGTVFQARAGIEDSPEAHYEDAMRINEGTADPRVLRLWTREAGPTLNWLADRGFEIAPGLPVRGLNHEHYKVERYLWGPQDGVSILNVLLDELDPHLASGQVEVLLDTGVVELIQDRAGAVTGVVVEDEAGRRQDLHAARVLLASGGCAANPRMYEDLHGLPLYAGAAYPFSHGDGLMLGLAAGGHLHGGDKYLGLFGTVMADASLPAGLSQHWQLDPGRRQLRELFVNAHGKRFVREDHPSVHHREMALDEQPGHRFWVVFDQRALDGGPSLVADMDASRMQALFDSHPMFFSAPTVASLAVRAGIHPLELQRSVDDYNARVAADEPDAFGREHRPATLETAPFYAVQCQGWTLVSFAGLVVDDALRVLRADGSAAPDLYAAGEVLGAGATSGKAYVGGALVTPALAFGRLLGMRVGAGGSPRLG